MRKTTRRLTLTRETLRQLDATTLREAAAAGPGGSFTTCCPSICVCPDPDTKVGVGVDPVKTSPNP